MTRLFKFLVAAFLLLPISALAQSGGQLQPGQVLGNSTASPKPAAGASLAAMFAQGFCNTQGAILTRNASTWVCLNPGTVSLPLLSGGAGGNVAYSQVPNAGILNPSTTVNGVTCTLGSTCTITASAGTITVGVTTVAGGPGLLYNTTSGGTLTAVTLSNNGVLVTNGSGVPSVSTTLPSGLSIPAPTITGALTYGGVALSAAVTGTGSMVLSVSPTITGTLSSAIHTITSNSASALAVGLNGATNPAFNVDDSTASSATGISIKSFVAGGGVSISAISSGTNEGLAINAKGSGVISIGNVSTGSVNITPQINSANHVITSASFNSFTVGLNGVTNPAFNVDDSTASSVTGVSIKSAAAGGGVALSTTSSGTNEALLISAKGTGGITIGNTSTGAVTINPAVSLTSTVNGLTVVPTGGGASLQVNSGVSFVVTNNITLSGTNGTTWTGPSSNANLAALNIASQTITGGAGVTVQALSTGSITADCTTRPLQTITGAQVAWSITAPSTDGSCIIKLTNAASSAVAPTFSGFTVGSNTGDPLTSVNSSAFMIWIARVGGTSTYSVKALQ